MAPWRGLAHVTEKSLQQAPIVASLLDADGGGLATSGGSCVVERGIEFGGRESTDKGIEGVNTGAVAVTTHAPLTDDVHLAIKSFHCGIAVRLELVHGDGIEVGQEVAVVGRVVKKLNRTGTLGSNAGYVFARTWILADTFPVMRSAPIGAETWNPEFDGHTCPDTGCWTTSL